MKLWVAALFVFSMGPVSGQAEEFKDIANKFKTWPELLSHFNFLNPLEKAQLAQIFKGTPMPKISVANLEAFESGELKVKLVSPTSGDFVVNGHTLKIQKGVSFKELCKAFADATQRPPKTAWLSFSLVPAAGASSLSEIDKNLISDSYIIARNPFRALDYEDSWMTWLLPSAAQGAPNRRLASKLTKASGLLLLAAWGGYYLDRAATQLNPLKTSCEGQVQDLKKMLKELRLAVSELDCGTWRGHDRSIKFWAPKAQDPLGKRYFKYDLQAGVLQENVYTLKQTTRKTKAALNPEDNASAFNEKKVGYYFSTFKWWGDPLTDVRMVEGTTDKKIVDINPKSNKTEFDRHKEDIEPYRQLLHYLGTNSYCEKCGEDKEHGPDRLADEEPPSYLNPRMAEDPKSTTTH